MAKIRLSFENFHASQWHFSRLFPYNPKILPTLHNSPSYVQLICIKRHLLLSISHSPLPLSHLFFSMYEMFFISCSPICIWGDIGAKSKKFAIKCTFSRIEHPFWQVKKAKQANIDYNSLASTSHCSLSDADFAHKESSPNFRVLRCVSQGKGCFSRTYARASNSDFTFLLSQVSQRAKNESSIRPLKGIVFPKTTCRFP